MTRLLPADRQQRAFALASLVNMAGSGLWIAASPLYATRVLGLGISAAGAALTGSALVGCIGGILVGYLADRHDARGVFVLTKVAGAAGMAALISVHSLVSFTAVCCAVAMLGSASAAARGAVVRGLAPVEPGRYRAYLQSVANLGVALGGGAAALAIQADSRAAYDVLLLANAGSSLACAILVWLFVRPFAGRAKQRVGLAIQDRCFLWFTVANGVLSLHAGLLTFALPLWVVARTHAPRGLVGLLLVLNAALVVLLQVRVAQRITTTSDALAMLGRAGVAFLVMAVAVAFAPALPGWAEMMAIVLGVVAYTIGELLHAAASFELLFRLAPAPAQGQYTGLLNLGQGVACAASPLLFGVICLEWGGPGWLLVGVVLASVGLLSPLALSGPVRRRLAQEAA